MNIVHQDGRVHMKCQAAHVVDQVEHHLVSEGTYGYQDRAVGEEEWWYEQSFTLGVYIQEHYYH